MSLDTYRVWLVPCDENGKRAEGTAKGWPSWMSNFMDVKSDKDAPIRGTILHIANNMGPAGENEGQAYFRVIDQYRFVDQTSDGGERKSSLTDRVELYIHQISAPL